MGIFKSGRQSNRSAIVRYAEKHLSTKLSEKMLLSISWLVMDSFSGFHRNGLGQSFDNCEVSKPKRRRISDSQFTQYKDIEID